MKKIMCELCGSVDIIKDGDFFTCQNCGTKYTIETARKMMIEGTVNITGSTVKVDITEQIDNLYTLARRAKQTHDFVGAEKYYSKIVEKKPDDWEAFFCSSYFHYMQCNIDQIYNAANSISSILKPTFELIDQNNSSLSKHNKMYLEVSEMTKTMADGFIQTIETKMKSVINDKSVDVTLLEKSKNACLDLKENCSDLLEEYGLQNEADILQNEVDTEREKDKRKMIFAVISIIVILLAFLSPLLIPVIF